MSIERDLELHFTRRQLFGLGARGIGVAALSSMFGQSLFAQARPGLPHFDLKTIRAVSLDPADDDIREMATHVLRSTFGALGTGRRPVVDEIAVAVAHLNAACVFARMHAGRLNYRKIGRAHV